MPWPQIGAIGAFREDDPLADRCTVYAVGSLETFTNLVTGQPPARGGTGAGLSKVNTDYGGGFATDGSANGFLTFGSAADYSAGTGDFACAILIDQGSLINSFGLFVSGGIELLFGGTAGSRSFRLNGGTATSSVTGLNDGRPHMAVFSRRDGVASWWSDGAPISKSTISSSVSATSPLTIGKRGALETYYVLPLVGMIGFWKRALSDEEALRLSRDPFLLARPLTTVAKAASVAATPANGAQAQGASSPSTTAQSVVSPIGAGQGHAAQSPSLSAASALVPNTSAQAQGAGEPSLGAGGLLAPDNGGQDQAASSPGLAAASALSPAIAAHDQATTSPSVAHQPLILPVTANHAMSATQPIVTTEGGAAYIPRRTARHTAIFNAMRPLQRSRGDRPQNLSRG